MQQITKAKISIITINYNGFNDTCELIETLPLEDEALEVIVVDNASKADEATLIKQRFPLVTVIRSEKNLGFAGGNNIGIKVAKGDYLLFLNNDTELKEDWNTNALIQRMQSNEHIGMVCPKIRFAWG
jgi:GT2 family glycosyltransferase